MKGTSTNKSAKAKEKIDQAVADDKSIVTADATPLVEAVDNNTAQTVKIGEEVNVASAEATAAAATAAVAAEDAKVQVEETKELIERRTRPRSLFQRLSALGIVLLLIYFVAASFTQSRATNEAVRDNKITLGRLAEANDRLTKTNDQLADQIDKTARQRDILAAVAQEQANRLREAGLEGVDIFDPNQTGGIDVTESSGSGDDGVGGQPGANPDRGEGNTSAPPRQGSSQPPNNGGGGNDPEPAPEEPQEDPEPPLVETCIGRTCVEVPNPLPTRLPVPPVGLSATVPTALAASEGSNDSTGGSMDINLFSADPNNVARGLGILVPILVGLLTKKYTDAKTKAITNVVASAIVGSAAYLVAENGGYDFAGFFNATLNAMIASFAAYYGVLKPTGAAAAIQNKTANIGVGKVDQAAKAADEADLAVVESPSGETEYVETVPEEVVEESVPAEDVAVQAIEQTAPERSSAASDRPKRLRD